MIAEVVERINASTMQPATKSNALALLALVHHDNGHCAISWEDLAHLFGPISISRTRKHMGLMQAAGLIYYSSDPATGTVYVNFKQWPRVGARKTTSERPENGLPVVEKRAPTRAVEQKEPDNDLKTRVGARNMTTERPKNDHQEATNGAAPIRVHTGVRASSLLVSSSSTRSKNKLTNKPPRPRPKRQPWEAPLSYRLLTDQRVALGPKLAEVLAKQHTFRAVRDAVAHWYLNRKSAGGKFDDTAGIVITWLTHPDDYTIPLASDEFACTELYRDYRPPEELAAERAAQRLAEQGAAAESEPIHRPAPPPEPPPEPGSPEAQWRQLQSELAIEQGGTFDRWVNDTWVIGYDPESNTFTIGLPDAFRYDWIVNRLSRQITRKLNVITGRPAAVAFNVAPRPGPADTTGVE